MAKELIDYIREIHKVAGSQVGVYFGKKAPYHIREILRICEAAEQSAQRIGLESYSLEELHAEVCRRRYVPVDDASG